MNDNGYFTRIQSSVSTTTASLEKFARFFADAENWPDGEIPEDVRLFVHVVGITPERVAMPTGNIGELSGDVA